MSAASHDRRYVIVWGVLLVALIVSLALGAVSSSPAVTAVIFAIAGVKAWLVVARFMHLSTEPRFLQLVMAGAVAAMACLFVGVYDDVAMHWSVLPLARADAGAGDAGAAVAEAALEPGDAGRGAKVYGTYCAGCHAADGRANGGTTGADFVADKTRLAKGDDELLRSIAEGKTGALGVMPAWKASLSRQQMVDVLAYVRGRFGGAP